MMEVNDTERRKVGLESGGDERKEAKKSGTNGVETL